MFIENYKGEGILWIECFPVWHLDFRLQTTKLNQQEHIFTFLWCIISWKQEGNFHSWSHYQVFAASIASTITCEDERRDELVGSRIKFWGEGGGGDLVLKKLKQNFPNMLTGPISLRYVTLTSLLYWQRPNSFKILYIINGLKYSR